MEKILVLVHTSENGELSKSQLEAFSASLQLIEQLPSSSLTVGLVGKGIEEAARNFSDERVDRYLGIGGDEYSVSRYSTDIRAVESLCKIAEATIVIASGTSRWNRSLPGAAYRLGGRADTHICEIQTEGEQVSVTRWYYRQRMQATQTSSKRPWILCLDPGTYSPVQRPSADVTLERLDIPVDSSALRSKTDGIVEPASGAQTIRPDADLLFVAGAGWTKKQSDGATHIAEAEKNILGFLRAAQASLGGSKSMVELSGEGQQVLSFMTHMNQIGQTGSTPRHPKGLATCCHGEEPHSVGWRFINQRRAINLDPNCGWAQGKADVLYVGDAFEIIARVNELLSR